MKVELSEFIPFTTTTGKEGLLLEVPSSAFGFDIQNYTTDVELIYMLNLEEISPELANDETLVTKKLPKAGKWSIAGDTKYLNHSQRNSLVIRDKIEYGKRYVMLVKQGE